MDWSLLEKQLRDMAQTGASLEIAPHDHLNPGHGWRCTLTGPTGHRTQSEGVDPYVALGHMLRGNFKAVPPPQPAPGPFGSNDGDEAALAAALADLGAVVECGAARVYLPGDDAGCIEARWNTGASGMWEVELLSGDGFNVETRDAHARLSEVVACVRTMYNDYAEVAS